MGFQREKSALKDNTGLEIENAKTNLIKRYPVQFSKTDLY